MSNRDSVARRYPGVGNAMAQNDVCLEFLPETEPMCTPFRDAAIDFIYQTALDLSNGRLKSAVVLLEITPEPDSETLNLTMTVDAD